MKTVIKVIFHKRRKHVFFIYINAHFYENYVIRYNKTDTESNVPSNK